MYKGVFVYSRSTANRRDNAFEWLKEEAKLCGLSLEICFEDECVIECRESRMSITFGGKPMDEVHFVVMRTYNDKISRYYESKTGVLVVNDSLSMRISRDKFLTHQALVGAGISTPHTIYAPWKKYDDVVKMLGHECFLVKKNDGCKGDGIYMVNNEDEFKEGVSLLRDNFVFQTIVNDSLGHDIRVWVIGNECVGAVHRYSNSSFLSNFSKGGNFMPVHIDDLAKKMSIQATRAVGLDFAGVDLLYCGDSYTVCEINGNAGFRTISSATDINVPAELFRYIKGRLK